MFYLIFASIQFNLLFVMFKKVVSFLLFLIVCEPVICQSSLIDSFKNVIGKNEGNRVDLLMEYADKYVDSIFYYDFTVTSLEEALDSAQSWHDDSLQINIYNYLGLANYYIGNYQKSTEYFFHALNLLDQSPNARQKSKIYNNLGMIFDELEDYDRALSFYQESFYLDSLKKNKKGLIISYINLGISYQHLNQYDASLKNYNKAYNLAQELGDSVSMIDVLNNLGTLEYDLKNYEESLDYYQQALQLYQKSNDLAGVAITQNNIGLVYLDEKEYSKALPRFKNALDLSTDLGMYDFSGDIFSNLSIYYEEVGDYKKALEYYDKYNEVHDSLISEKQDLAIRKLEAQYQSEKKQREILELQQVNMQQKELLNDSKNIQGYLYVIILLVIIFLAILFFLLRKERRLARELQEKTKELKKLNISKDRFFSIIAHDLKNPFNALVGYTSLLRSDFDSFSKKEISQIIADLNEATEKGFALLENLLYWTRSQTNRIKVFKTSFNLKQLIDGVVSLAGPNLAAKSQTVEINIDEDLKMFADKDMIATVIRNLAFNAIKFSYPESTIRVEGKKIGDKIQVSVIDHGVGIDADKQHKFFNYEENTTSAGTDGETGSGLGLVICKEFIEKNNGMIWVESELGKGATFRFSIPYIKSEKQ